MNNETWAFIAGAGFGLAIGLLFVRWALTDAIHGMSEEKAMDRAREIVEGFNGRT